VLLEKLYIKKKGKIIVGTARSMCASGPTRKTIIVRCGWVRQPKLA